MYRYIGIHRYIGVCHAAVCLAGATLARVSHRLLALAPTANLRATARAWSAAAKVLARRRALLAPFGCLHVSALRAAARRWHARYCRVRFEQGRLRSFKRKVGWLWSAEIRNAYTHWRDMQRLAACSRKAYLRVRRGSLRRGLACWVRAALERRASSVRSAARAATLAMGP